MTAAVADRTAERAAGFAHLARLAGDLGLPLPARVDVTIPGGDEPAQALIAAAGRLLRARGEPFTETHTGTRDILTVDCGGIEYRLVHVTEAAVARHMREHQPEAAA